MSGENKGLLGGLTGEGSTIDPVAEERLYGPSGAPAPPTEQPAFIQTMDLVERIDSAKFAKAIEVGKETGLAPIDLYQRSDAMEKLLSKNRYAAIMDRYKRTAAALEDPSLAAVAKDDLDLFVRIEDAVANSKFNELGAGEKFMNAINQQMNSSAQGVIVQDLRGLVDLDNQLNRIDELTASGEYDEAQAGEIAVGGFGRLYLQADAAERAVMRQNLTDQAERYLASLGERESRDFAVEPAVRRIEQLKEAGESSLSAVATALAENPAYGLRLGAAAAVDSWDMLVTAALSGPAAPLTAGFVGYGKEFDAKFLDVMREAGVDPRDAKSVIAFLADDGKVSEASDRAALKAAGTTAVDLLSMRLASKLLVPKSVGGRQLTDGQRELANLAVQTPLQGITEGAGEAAGQYLADGEVDAGEVLLEAVAGASMASVDVAVFGNNRVRELVGTNLAQRRKARLSSELVGAMSSAALESQTRKNSPDAYRAITSKQLEGTNAESVWLPAAELNRLNQSAMIDLNKLIEQIPDLGAQLDDATARDGSVQIKTADYLTYLAEHHESLANHVRLASDAHSLAEMEALNAELESQIDELAASLKTEESAAAKLSRNMIGELVSMGYRRQDAEQYAATHLSVMESLSERTGIALEELTGRFDLSVSAKARDQLRAVPVDDIRLALGRIRSGDIPNESAIYGQTLREFLAQNGGLVDDGGELAALDIDNGKVGRNRLVRKGGMTLDQAATRAREFGFFQGSDPSEMGPQHIIDALRSELAGSPIYSAAQENQTLQDQAATLNELADYLARLEVEIDQLTDDEIINLLRGGNESNDGDTRLNQADGNGDLIVAHNLSADNLRHALELGGLPAPSLAITKADTPIEGFGEITLIGPVSMAEPSSKNPIFDADVYSPRFPDVKVKVDERAVVKALEPLRLAAEQAGQRMRDSFYPIEDMKRGKLAAAISSISYDDASRLGYANAILGKSLVVPTKTEQVSASVGGLMSDARLALKVAATDLKTISPNTDGSRSLAKAVDGATGRQVESMLSARKAEPDYLEQWANAVSRRLSFYGPVETDGSGLPVLVDLNEEGIKRLKRLSVEASSAGESRQSQGRQVPDYDELRVMLDREAPREQFDSWLSEQLSPAMGERRIVKSDGKTTAYTLDNLVKEMTKKVRDAEGFNYGLGNARSKGAKRFKSLGQIQNKRGQITSKEETSAAIEANGKLFDQIVSKLDEYNPYAGERYGQITLEWAAEVIGDSYGNGIKGALALHGVSVPAELEAELAQFASDLLSLPTEYFEAKPQRAVELSEFVGAVVPDDLPADLLAALEAQGMAVTKYSRGERASAVRAAAESLNQAERVLFQSAASNQQTSKRFTEDNRLSNLSMTGPSWERMRQNNKALRSVKSADDVVTIYRATIGDTIRPDDFVALDSSTLSVELENVRERDGDGAKIISLSVPVRDLLMGNDSTEFVYFPEPTRLNQSFGPIGTPHTEAETGKPMRVYFARNTVSSKVSAPAGMDFGQKIEPAGEYMVIQDSDMSEQGGEGWVYGSIEFANPLVLEHKSTNSTGWKKDLSDMFGGKTGKALANAVKKAGYDAIVTVDGKYGYSETVNLSGVKSEPAPTTRLNQSALPETIEIDGVDRPTQNSNGQPIAQTEEGVRNFWRWFGDSKAVDDQGRPLVVYHGTGSDFSAFDLDAAGSSTDSGMFGEGFYFASSPEESNHYAKKGDAPRLMPVYLSLKNPFETSDYKALPAIPQAETIEEMLIADKLYSKRMRAELIERGHDGLIFTRQDGSKELVAFHPEQIKSAIGNRGTFDPNDASILRQSGEGDDARGFISFKSRAKAGDSRKFTITLTEKRDLSTLLHELGHFYLEVMDDLAASDNATDQIRSDVKNIREWVGAADGQPFTTEQHEQFARGFERYLAEGKAPSVELAGAFARFKRWIIQVYKDLSRLNVELTDEIRGVFDRMVATDEQITQAEMVSEAIPLFADAQKAGMSEADFAAYQDSIAISHAEAQEEVERQIVNEEERRRSKWWKEELGRITDEVAEEFDTVPVYAAMNALRKGQMPDGTPLNLKLNSTELTERYGASNMRKLAFMHSRTGVSSEVVAPLFGFNSGDEMIKAMLGAVPRSAAIEQEATLRMEERHGKRQDGESADAAIYAVHNDRRADVLMKELNALAKQGNRKSVTSQQILKEAAKRAISSRKVRDVQPIEYQRAEAKAAREAFNAALKGDLETAYEAKQRQLLNFFMYREAVKGREAVADIVTRMQKFNNSKTRQRLGKAGHDYLDQIDAVMEQYEFRTVSLRQLDKRKSVAAWYKEQVEAGNDPVVPQFVLENSQRINYKELTLEQLTELDEHAQNVAHLAGLKNKLLRNKRLSDMQEARSLMAASAFANADKRKAAPIVRASKSLPQVVGDWLRAGNSSLLKMEQVISWLDGDNIDGAWNTAIFRPLAEAQHESDTLNKEYGHKVAELHAQWIKERGSSVAQTFHIGSINQPMPTTGMLAVALNSGNASNLQKMLKGFGWDQSVVDEILSHMTSADWRYVKGLWDTVESLWPMIEALEKRVNGVAPPKIEPLKVMTPDGEIDGAYWPLIYDPLSTKYADVLNNVGAVAPLGEGGAVRSTPARGHTEARIDSFAAPLLLDVSVVGHHITQVIHDLTHREVLRDVRSLFTGEAREAVAQTLGPEMAAQIINQFDGIANGASSGDMKAIGTFAKVMNGLRSNQALAWMGYSLTTVFNQLAGYSQGLEYFAKRGQRRHLIKAFGKFWANPIGNLEMMREMSGEMRNRAENLDASIREAQRKIVRMKDGRMLLDSLKTAADARDLMVKYAFTPMQVMQSVVDGVVWMAAYEAEGGVNNHESAVAAADQAVRLTQTAGGAKDLATIQQNVLAKLFMPVYGYASLLWNRNNDLARDFGRAIKQRSPRQALVAFERFIYLNILPAIVAGMIRGELPDDDDDDEFLGGWAEFVGVETLQSVTMGIPIVGPVVAGAFSPFGYSGASPVGQGFDAAMTAFSASKDQTVATSAVTALGMFTGLPSSQINRAIRTVFMVENGEMDDAALSVIRAALFGPPAK